MNWKKSHVLSWEHLEEISFSISIKILSVFAFWYYLLISVNLENPAAATGKGLSSFQFSRRVVLY